jgi:AcrR family transcriptional regulator
MRPTGGDATRVTGPARTTRQEKAAATRARMLAAAATLFQRHGFVGTKIETIAHEANVAVQTVYFTFGNKRAILTELLDQAIAGDDQPVPTLERPWVRQAMEAPDPREQLRIQTAAARQIFERAAPILEVVRNAAAADPEMAELWRANADQRRTVYSQLAAALVAKGGLASRLSITQAVDVVFALVSPELYYLLVLERGWSPQQWEDFVMSSLQHHLIG